MREYATPLDVEIPSAGNLTDDLVRYAEEEPDRVAFSRPNPTTWSDVTAADFLAEVRGVAKGLVASGIRPGDRVGLLSRTRYEWTLVDYAIWFAGAVTVPLYETSSAEQIAWILEDSGATALVAEAEADLKRVDEAFAGTGVPQLRWSFEQAGVGLLTDLGTEVSDEELEQRRTIAGPDSPATIVYTSGTTGGPKGCVLTHGNFMFELGVAVDGLHELFQDPEAATLLFLPLAHVFARVIQVGAVRARIRLGHTPDVKTLMVDLSSFRPTFILAVPRVFEKVFNTASQNAAADGKGRVFDLAVRTAMAYSRSLDQRGPGPVLRLRHRMFDRLVYGRLRSALGGRCRYAISGGAPLGERLGHFYRGIGLVVLEGYGLTETTGALTANLPETSKIGSVGRPLAGTTVRIADDGELLVRGGQVFAGYWQDDAGTAATLSADGWLSTGDLGEIDDEGFVRITGRKKEIIVTAGGKNVAPNLLEGRLRAHQLVSQCMVVGDGQPYIAALVTLDQDALAIWTEQRDKPRNVRRLIEDADLRAEIQTAVDEANKAVSKAESIRGFSLLPGDWTEETGELTPSLKLKREVIVRRHSAEIAKLYD